MGGATRALSAAPAAEIEAPEPLPVYVVTPEQILAGTYLETASLEGWSYTMFRGETPLAGAELAQVETEDDLHFTHFSEGPFVEATVTAIAQAEAFSEQTDQDFEPRIFRCPPLYVMAVWLYSESRDVLIPMAPTHRLLTAGRAFEREEFDGLLIEAANESLRAAARANPQTTEPET
jgi:hypothetical protein